MFRISRFIWAQGPNVIWAALFLTVMIGLAGPKYSASLGGLVSRLAPLTVAFSLVVWIAVMTARKKRPGVQLRDVVQDAATWNELAFREKAAWTGLSLAIAAIFLCIGVLLGAIATFYLWRIL